MDETGASPGTPTLVASLNKWSLDQAREKAKVTAFGDTNHQYVQGLPDVKGSLAGWWDDAELRLFEVASGETPVTLKLVPSSLAATLFFSGPAYLDASIEVGADGGVSISSEFVASGDWTQPVSPLGRSRVVVPGQAAPGQVVQQPAYPSPGYPQGYAPQP